MNIKQYISKNLIDFKSISLIYSDVITARKNITGNYSEVSIQKYSTKDASAFGASSGSDFIFAIGFIFILILIPLGIAVGLYRWKKRIKYRRQPEGIEFSATSENQSAPTPQMESRLHSDEPPEIPGVREDYDVEFQSLEEMALDEIKNARCREIGQISEYCVAISWAIKKYVGEKYHIKIVGASTSQILDSLPQELTDSAFDYVGEILRTCDMIGMSQHRPSRGELDHIYQIATTFIQRQIQPDDTEEAKMDELDERAEPPEWFRRFL